MAHTEKHPLQTGLQEKMEWILAYAKTQGADQVEVSGSLSQGFSVEVRLGELENLSYHDNQEFSITVYRGQSRGSASTADLATSSLETVVKAAIERAAYTEPDPYQGLASREELAFDYPEVGIHHPDPITPHQALEDCLACEASALSYDQRIVNSEGVSFSSEEQMYCYGNSQGFIGLYPRTTYIMACGLIGSGHPDDLQSHSEYTLSCCREDLLSPQVLAHKTAQDTLKQLAPRRIKTGRFPVIFEARVARGFFGHFAAAIQGRALYRKASFLRDQLHQPIFPAWMQMREEPHLWGGVASQPFDSDGVLTRAKSFVQDGVLKSYALGVYSARKLNAQTTGNADGIHNLLVQSGSDDLPTLLKKMDTGLLITAVMGQGINMVTGDYSRGAFGFWVEKGEIQYPVHQITLAGNLKDLFAHIVAVGNDVDARGSIQTGSVWLESMTIAGE